MHHRTERAKVQRAIAFYLAAFVAMSGLAWLFWLWEPHNPSTFPLGDTSQRFGDLVRFSGKNQIGKPAHMRDFEGLAGTLFPRNYTPFSAVVYVVLLQMCAPYAVVILLALELGAIGVACAHLWRSVRSFAACRWYVALAIFLTGLLGWGTEQVVMRGNIEGLVWIGVCVGAVMFARSDSTGAGIGFGMACCVKPQPVLWLALMARHKRYRGTVAGLLTIAAVTIVSLFMINPNPVQAYHKVYSGSGFFENYVVALRPIPESRINHSLLESMKTIARVVRNHGTHFGQAEFFTQPNDPLAWKLYHVCIPLTALLALLAVWRVWNKPVLNQMFALACATAVLPTFAADYTLIVLLVPMGFFLILLLQDVAEGRVKISLAQMLWFLMPCAWIMATEPLVIIHGVLKCIALLVLLAASISVPLPSTVFRELTAAADAAEPDPARAPQRVTHSSQPV